MIRFLLIFFLIPLITIAQDKEPFKGKLVYKVEIVDSALKEFIPVKQMVVYTNDTLTRIENETDQLGKQVVIKHLTLNKSYLLIETPDQNFAIQTDDNKLEKKESKYTFRKKCFKKKIAGVRANRLVVSHPDMKTEREYLYLKKYSPKYINTFEDFPGLPVHYFIITVDGVYEYTLTSIEYFTPEKDLFGIPSDYKRVTFDEFLNYILQQEGNEGNE